MEGMDNAGQPRFWRHSRRAAGAVLAAGLLLAGCGSAEDAGEDRAAGESAGSTANAAQPERLEATVHETYPWDPSSFTQGVEVAEDGRLLVGTGRNGESRIYHTTKEGKQSESQDLDEKFFGEGVTRHVAADGTATVWQLTWKENTAFRRDADTLKEQGQAHYDGEGWGICSTGEKLVMSDGSGTLTFRDPETFEPTGTVDVTLAGEPTDMLNELDCSGGQVWANVWQTDEIYRIDPATGEVTGVADLSGLLPAASRAGADVLNGIAHIPGTDRFYLTGKLWDEMYEVSFSPA